MPMKTTKPKIQIINLDVWYDYLHVLDMLSFTIHEGEVVSIIGPSGCGKSTLLLYIGGLLRNKRGTVFIDQGDVFDSSPNISIIFQDLILFPWKTLRDNILLGLKKEKIDKETAIHRANQFIKKLNLSGFENHYPSQLSGGMKQRAAIAQAYVSHSKLILMDEPFGSLDALTRRNVQSALLQIIENHKKTVIMVTHDIDEALLFSDRIIILSQKPARIVAEIAVPFTRPRKHDLLMHKQAAFLKKNIFKLLE